MSGGLSKKIFFFFFLEKFVHSEIQLLLYFSGATGLSTTHLL